MNIGASYAAYCRNVFLVVCLFYIEFTLIHIDISHFTSGLSEHSAMIYFTVSLDYSVYPSPLYNEALYDEFVLMASETARSRPDVIDEDGGRCTETLYDFRQ